MEEKSRKGILVVSYGSSYKEEREKGIGGIERTIGDAFPEFRIYRAFTSETIIELIKNKEGIEICTIQQAMENALADGIKEMIVIQTHLMRGKGAGLLKENCQEYESFFDKFVIADPILNSKEDIQAFVKVLAAQGAEYIDGKTAVCYVGHGIADHSEGIYGDIQRGLECCGYEDYYIGTLSGVPTREQVKSKAAKKERYRRIIFIPMLLIAGHHVQEDIMGTSQKSWKNIFLREGYEVECVRHGLGEYPMVQNIFVEHIKSVIL